MEAHHEVCATTAGEPLFQSGHSAYVCIHGMGVVCVERNSL